MPATLVPHEVLAVFRAEAADHLATLTAHLQALAENPSAEGHWPALRRAAHTLKAAAGIVGYTDAADRTHALEDRLEHFADAAHPATRADVETLRAAVREIAAALPAVEALPLRDGETIPPGALEEAVRHAAGLVGKNVRLEIAGDWAAVDPGAFEVLLHLLRNAVDHGIEPPAVRRSLGKPAVGTVRVAAEIGVGSTLITVADDGRGIEPGVPLHRIFEPGFSTQPAGTTLSGRGVGLNVVAAGVARLNGSVAVSTGPGRGTTVALRIPAARSVT